jgi:capsular exopolysaccharide synthesis family protein
MSNGTLPAPPDPDDDGIPLAGPSTETPGAGRDTSLDVSSIIQTLWGEKWIILLTGIIVTGLVGGYTYTQPSIYQSSSLVKVGSQGGGVAQVAGSIAGEAAVNQTPGLSGEVGVLQNSIELARRVAKELKTHEDADEGKGFPVLAGGARPEAVGRRILGKVEFAPRRERNMIAISVESQDPEEAAAIANLYAKEYRRYSQEEARSSVQAARSFLKTQARQQRRKIDSLESEWEAFVRKNRLIERGEGGENITSKFNELKARRDEVDFELDKQKTQLELLRQQLRQLRPKVEQGLLEQQEASGLRNDISALEERIAAMRAEAATYYATNPELEGDSTRIQREFPDLARLLDQMRALEERKRKLTRQLVDKVSSGAATSGSPVDRVAELRRQITEKQLTIEQLRSQRSALAAQVDRYEAKLGDIPDQRIRREQIQRKLKQAEAFHKTIMSKLQRITVAEESELGYVQVVQSAFVPSTPIRPEIKTNLIQAIILGLALGVGLAFLREEINPRLRDPKDIEDRGYSLLGVVPNMDPEIERAQGGRDFVEVEGRTLSTRLVPLLNPWSPVTENYRLIRANLGRNGGDDPRTLLVTSAQKEEGKTVTAVNLALTEALSGRRTLLIDADMRKPTAHEALGMPRTPGLASLLQGPPEAKCWKTLVDGLCFIPAGVAKRGPANILDSDRVRDLLEEMREHFDVIVLDTPPTQAASDSIVIGTQTDVRTVVVSAADRDIDALDSVMESLRTAGVPVAGVVLNKFDDRAQLSGSYSYSYYGHDDEYADYRLAAAGEEASP